MRPVLSLPDVQCHLWVVKLMSTKHSCCPPFCVLVGRPRSGRQELEVQSSPFTTGSDTATWKGGYTPGLLEERECENTRWCEELKFQAKMQSWKNSLSTTPVLAVLICSSLKFYSCVKSFAKLFQGTVSGLYRVPVQCAVLFNSALSWTVLLKYENPIHLSIPWLHKRNIKSKLLLDCSGQQEQSLLFYGCPIQILACVIIPDEKGNMGQVQTIKVLKNVKEYFSSTGLWTILLHPYNIINKGEP